MELINENHALLTRYLYYSLIFYDFERHQRRIFIFHNAQLGELPYSGLLCENLPIYLQSSDIYSLLYYVDLRLFHTIRTIILSNFYYMKSHLFKWLIGAQAQEIMLYRSELSYEYLFQARQFIKYYKITLYY